MLPFLRKHSQLSGHLPKKQTVKTGSVIRAAARGGRKREPGRQSLVQQHVRNRWRRILLKQNEQAHGSLFTVGS